MSNTNISKNLSEKYTLFPIKYNNLWNFYKNHLATFWIAEEIRLNDDLNDWNNKINDNEKYFIKNVLAFFASSDGIVNENLLVNFYNEIDIPEVRQFYSVQMLIESIHQEVYSLLIDTYIDNVDEKNELFQAIDNNPAIKKKADWAIKWIDSGNSLKLSIKDDIFKNLIKMSKDSSVSNEYLESIKWIIKERPNLAQRLLAFICVEGIFFSGSFCAIYWLKSRGLLPGLSTANQFIARDENLHVEFAIELFKTLNLSKQISEKNVYAIFKEAVEIELEFVQESLPVSLIGMNKDLMGEYIQYIADRWLVLLGYKKIWNKTCPFSFMDLISVNNKTNFFENNVSNYVKSNVGTNDKDRIFKLDEDF